MTIIKNTSPESRQVKALVDGLDKGTILVDDSFQRQFVWGAKDQIALIETILLGYPIPEIYLWQTSTDPDSGETKLSVVDGQQRIRSVYNFIKDEFKLEKRYLEDGAANYSGKYFSELSPVDKSEIWKYPFTARLIKEEISYADIVKLFLRLNRTNIALNPQELRNAAFGGKFLRLADKIASLSFWTEHNVFNATDLRRMGDIQFISTLLIFLRRGIEEETSQAVLNRLYDQYNEVYTEERKDLAMFNKILKLMEELVVGKKHMPQALKSKTHFYTLFVLSYYALSIASLPVDVMAKKLEMWYRHYFSDSSFKTVKNIKLLEEFRLLMQEGVQKKSNRLRRFEILKEYLF
jgi:hypothetical protein